ncbi:MAG: hypothetical protein PF693_13595 [Spirochaetia bacterium]|jgi:hypothetical protein|nr:hypothetical protein [Spirochaetia bacterium]
MINLTLKDEMEIKKQSLGSLRLIFLITLLWTLIVVILLSVDLISLKQNTKNLAVTEARAHLNKDEAFDYTGRLS